MAITTAVTTASSVSYQQNDIDSANSNKYFRDIGSYQYTKNYEDAASGLGAVNSIWHDRLSISGTKQILDLQNLTTTLFGFSITETFTGVKDVYIENSTTGIGRNINLHSTGTLGWTNLWDGGSGNITLRPNSCFHLNNWAGWNVTNINRELTIEDMSGSGITTNIFFAGLSGIN